MPKKSDKPRDPSQIVALQVRIREDLRAQIEAAANVSGTSMNSEIADRLATSLREDEVLGSGPTRSLMARIAGDVSLIEQRTGKGWTSDLATFEAVRLMIEATVLRHRPPRENQAEVFSFLEREGEDRKREDVLEKALIEHGAIAWRQPNALIALADKNAPSVPYLGETHPDEWHQPNEDAVPLSREEREALMQILAEWRTLRGRYTERLKQMQAFKEPIEKAEREGAQIFEEVNGLLHQNALKALGGRDGA